MKVSPHDAGGAVRRLVEKIVLTPEGGRLRIDLKGDIEGIFEISAIPAKQKPARDTLAGGPEQLKLVAGQATT